MPKEFFDKEPKKVVIQTFLTPHRLKFVIDIIAEYGGSRPGTLIASLDLARRLKEMQSHMRDGTIDPNTPALAILDILDPWPGKKE